MSVILYHFDLSTREFLRSSVARVDPKDTNKYLTPRGSTDIQPPNAEIGQVQVFFDGAWSIKVDNRGVEYWLADGSRHVIENLDEVLPEGALTQEPPKSKPDQLAAGLVALEIARAAALAQFTGNKPAEVIATYSRKLIAAEAISSGSGAEMHMRILRKRAAERGQSVAEFAAYILYKDELYASFVDAADTEFERAEKLIGLAVAPSVPIDQVAPQIQAALDGFGARVIDAGSVILSSIQPPN